MEWNSDLAYAVGLITTDGNLSSDGRHIDLTSKDLEQILNFENIIKTNNKIGLKSSSTGGKKKYYHIQFSNVKFYTFLKEIGLTPHKSKTLGVLKIPDKYFIDFLRGCLDGDGYTYSYWDKRWKSSFMFYTGFSCASLKHLIWLQESIKRLYNIHGAIKKCRKTVYQLMYAKTNSLLLVKKIYYCDRITCLSRKRFKIKAALDIISTLGRDGEMVDAQS